MNNYFKRNLYIFFMLCLSSHLSAWAQMSYQVMFSGIEDQKTIDLLKESSRTVCLSENLPKTKAGLKRRAEEDITEFLRVLQSLGYYGATVKATILDRTHPVQVVFTVNTGPIYPLVSYKIISEPKQKYEYCFDFNSLTLCDIGITLNKPALPKVIVNAEDTLLQKMENVGYPLATILKREVIADQTNKTISVVIHVDSGPLCLFGETVIEGNKTVCEDFFRKKIEWSEGEVYNPNYLQRTQTNLEASGLFSSITITHAEEAVEGYLKMTISVHEGKQRSVAAGLSYATEQGPGVLAEWEHRNIRGCGEKLSFKANIAQLERQGRLLYVIPDFQRPKQDLLWLLESQQLIVRRSFEASSVSFSGIIERQISDPLRISYGGMYKFLQDTHSENNGSFHLLKAPFQLRWNKSNNLLDPTHGHVVTFKTVPTVRVFSSDTFGYCINNLIFTNYYSITKDSKYVLANKINVGVIFGPGIHTIPSSELIYAGSDNNLRGYTFMTVSPLDHHYRPEGGRSMLTFSTDLRVRINETWGYVIFHDIGNVYKNYYPRVFSEKVLQSVGIGARYSTPVGPLRFDVAFPLNRRRHLDPFCQIYFSIGQAF